MRIGIFGGSFDPIHNGHIRFAQSALKGLKLDRLYFVPTKFSPFKNRSPLASEKSRVELIEIALKGEDRFKIEDCELRRKGASYSYQTVRDFKKKFPKSDLFLLLGDDAFSTFKEWKNVREILKFATLIVASRQRVPCSSTEIRKKIKKGRTFAKELPKSVRDYINKNRLYV